MLKIIFGNVARKDHYNLSKSNTKKKNIWRWKLRKRFKKKKKYRSGRVGPKTNLRQTQILDLNSTQVFIQPAQDLQVGWVGLAGPMLIPMPHNAQSSYLPCKAQSYVTSKKKKKEKKKSLVLCFISILECAMLVVTPCH